MRLLFIPALLITSADAFVPGWTYRVERPSLAFPPNPVQQQAEESSSTALFAKKKPNAKLAALEALENLEEVADQSMSKKELLEMEKKKQKEEKAAAADEKPKMSNKMRKMMEMDQLDAETAASAPQEVDDDQPKLSKKELKALQKKEEKMERQAAAKAEKKAARAAGDLEMPDEEPDEAPDEEPKVIVEDVPEEIAEPEAPEEIIPITLEDKIRKERPPPRIRVMESAQPGFVSLRLEKVGITFRNQEVLKDVTWGVQSGDRIGLVGRNGAGKTTQLRIMAGELEPTTGDLVKSSGTLRTAMLRQEFVDELVKERTLKEEFLSVFEEENKILQDLKDAEEALENMAGEDPDAMQQILDRMQELQQRAEDKDVYILESRVKKTMDLMGFNDEEGEDLVASFSGGWKMRIGLGKVLLKDPNVLLLGK
jgi:ABC-type nitrate/sulfonate/bicarbonate transport system ATPase subunit